MLLRDVMLNDTRHCYPRARDVMSRSIVYCHDDDDRQTAAAIMAQAHVRRLPVLWHTGQPNLIGVISLDDIAEQIDADLIQEIVHPQRLPDPQAVARGDVEGGTVIT